MGKNARLVLQVETLEMTFRDQLSQVVHSDIALYDLSYLVILNFEFFLFTYDFLLAVTDKFHSVFMTK